MYIPAGVLADPKKTEHADASFYGYDSEDAHASMRETKIQESRTGSEFGSHFKLFHDDVSLHDSIKREGVKSPVSMYTDGPTLMDGHHRVFSAADIDPKIEVPVEWYD